MDFEALPQVIAIVGSRDFPHEYWVQAFVEKLKPRTLVVSGEARGVDTFAKEAVLARKKRQGDIYFKPIECTDGEWKLFGRRAGILRNEDIVLFLKKHKGHMVIFALQEQIDAKRGGSYNDIEWCETYGVPYTLFTM